MTTADNRAGDIARVSPTHSEAQPPQGNQTNADPDTNNVSVNNEIPTTQHETKNQHQEPRWRRSLSYIFQHFPRADSWLAVFTFLLVIETFLTIRVLSATDKALHQTAEATTRIREITEADDRGWIAPLTPDFTTNAVINLPIQIAARYVNVGRSPATRMKISVVFDTIEKPPGADFARLPYISESFCTMHPAINDMGMAYPGISTNTYYVSTSQQQIIWDQELADEHKMLRMRECISYITFDKVHHVWACYVSAGRLVANRDRWVGADCNGGQGAD